MPARARLKSVLVDDAPGDEEPAQRVAGDALLGQGRVDVGGGQESVRDEPVTESGPAVRIVGVGVERRRVSDFSWAMGTLRRLGRAVAMCAREPSAWQTAHW